MKAGQGKNKGSEFERQIGYKLSLWLSHGQRKDLLCRTVGSGAQFTFAQTKNGMAGIPGDLRSQDPLSDKFCNIYVIECKFWRDLEMIKFLAKEGELYKALVKVQNEANKVGKMWMLIARQNRRPDILLTSPSQWLGDHTLFNNTCYMFQLDDFLTRFTPEMLLCQS